MSFLLLMMVFRSLLVPLKAVILNVLSIAGAYGVVVALFQWGHLSGITGLADALLFCGAAYGGSGAVAL